MCPFCEGFGEVEVECGTQSMPDYTMEPCSMCDGTGKLPYEHYNDVRQQAADILGCDISEID